MSSLTVKNTKQEQERGIFGRSQLHIPLEFRSNENILMEIIIYKFKIR